MTFVVQLLVTKELSQCLITPKWVIPVPVSPESNNELVLTTYITWWVKLVMDLEYSNTKPTWMNNRVCTDFAYFLFVAGKFRASHVFIGILTDAKT